MLASSPTAGRCPRHSDSRHGSTAPEAESACSVSASAETLTYARCSFTAHEPSFELRLAKMIDSANGSRASPLAVTSTWPRLRSRTRRHAWPGRCSAEEPTISRPNDKEQTTHYC